MQRKIIDFQLSIFNSRILKLALPSVVTNITVPLLGLVDMAIVGHMGKAEYIGAVAIGTTILSMLYWLFGFLRMGTTGIVSQAYGAKDLGLISEGLRRSLMWALLIASVMLALQTPLLRFSMWLMKPEPELAQYASEYLRVAIWGAPAMLASYCLTGWFIGMQDTRTPMWMAILQNVTNILCTLLFVFVLHLGVAGVALGTVVGLYSGIAYAAHRGHRGDREHRGTHPLAPPNEGEERSHSHPQGEKHAVPSVFSAFSVYFPIFLRTLCLVAVTVYFTTAGSRLGSLYLDGNALLMQFFIVYSYFTDGLANAAEALSGEYVGRRDRAGLLRVVRQLFLWGLALALVFTTLYALCGAWFLSLLTNQEAVLQTARAYLPWVVAIPFVAIPAFVWDGVYIGMTRTKHMFVSMLMSAIVFFSLWFLLHHFAQSQPHFHASQLGNHALWFSFLAYLGTRSIMQTVLFGRKS